MFDRNAIKIGVFANLIVSEATHMAPCKAAARKNHLRASKVDENRPSPNQRALIGVGRTTHFSGSIRRLHVVCKVLNRANSSAIDYLSELNVGVLLRSATKYA